MRSLIKRNAAKGVCIGFSIASLLVFAGCVTVHNTPYTMQPIELSEEKNNDSKSDALIKSIMDPGVSGLQIGDNVRILTLDGKRRYTKVSDIRPGGITVKFLFAKPREIKNNEIVFLEKEVRSWGNQWSLFPMLEESREGDDALYMDQIRDELVRVDVLRRAINLEISELSLVSFGSVITLQLQDVPTKQLARDKQSRAAANARMIKLLELWQASSDTDQLLPGGESVESISNDIEELNAKKGLGRSRRDLRRLSY